VIFKVLPNATVWVRLVAIANKLAIANISTDEEGNVFIANSGTVRSFDLLSDGTYQAQNGDFAPLSLDQAAGNYTLTESDGTATVFNDEAGEVRVTDAQGNENGQVARLTDANGRLINFGYDDRGNLTDILVPDNNSTAFTYDDRGNLTSQIDASGNTTEFTYDSAYDQLTGFTDPLGNGINYSYDEAGNLK
jgi:YD repeat-containing protein